MQGKLVVSKENTRSAYSNGG